MSFVYLICDPKNEYYKIGVTTGTIENRIKKLQTGNGTELHVTSWFKTSQPFKLEKLLHSKFGSKRQSGEWFALDTPDIINFKDICQKLQETLDCLMENPFYNKELRT